MSKAFGQMRQRGVGYAFTALSAVVAALLYPLANAWASDEGRLTVGDPDVDREGNARQNVLAPAVSADVGALALSASGVSLVWVAVPVWSPSGDEAVNGGVCRGVRYVGAPTEEEAAALRTTAVDEYWTLWTQVISNDVPAASPDFDCPVDPAQLLPAAVLRDAVRAAVVDQLPRPAPSVPPGWALTGLPAYLVTAHELDYSGRHVLDLDLFPVTVDITAVAETHVDWGDGTRTTHLVAGLPYPDGQVHHTYVDTGARTLTVTDTWTVTFTVVDPVSLTDALVATLDPVTIDLEVRQLQAIRTTTP